MNKKNIKTLVIGPYPIIEARNGGQKRARAIYNFYKTLGSATYCGVFHRGHYQKWDKYDLPIGDPAIIAEVDKLPFATELICGKAIDKDLHVRSYMAKFLIDNQPDIIHLEQPFAYLGIKPLLEELKINPIIIFGSQNIEYPLKQRIFKELKVARATSEKFVAITKKLEYDLSCSADMVVAVNHEDAQTHREMGARHIIIAPNGIDRLHPPKESLDMWARYKEQNNLKTLITFVGSGHPPNWEGFEKLIGNDLSFLPLNSRIVIAGGVGHYFKNTYDQQKSKFWQHVDILGEVDEDTLSGLVVSSDVVLLPVVTKRGSNLKTAEAIMANTKIVATSSVFHGFEKYKDLPNIFIGNNSRDFHRAIITASSKPLVARTQTEQYLARRVEWEYCLASMKRPIMKIYFKKSLNARFHKLIHELKRKVSFS